MFYLADQLDSVLGDVSSWQHPELSPEWNSPCYFLEGLPVYCSVDLVINPSTPPPGATTRHLVCKDKLTLLNNGISMGYVTTETALLPRESDKADIMGKAAFVHPQASHWDAGPHHFWITAKASYLPPSLPVITHASNPPLFTLKSLIFLNSKTYPGPPLLNTFCGSQSHWDVWNAIGGSLLFRPCMTQFLKTFV